MCVGDDNLLLSISTYNIRQQYVGVRESYGCGWVWWSGGVNVNTCDVLFECIIRVLVYCIITKLLGIQIRATDTYKTTRAKNYTYSIFVMQDNKFSPVSHFVCDCTSGNATVRLTKFANFVVCICVSVSCMCISCEC